jgi:histidine ammonia-lyase
MTAFAALAAVDARRLALLSDVCTALCVEVLGGIAGPFDRFLHDVAKPHPGQMRSPPTCARASKAARSRGLRRIGRLGTSEAGYRELEASVQDKYSSAALRSSRASSGTPRMGERWLEIETSSNDNPLSTRNRVGAQRRQLRRRPRRASDGRPQDRGGERRRLMDRQLGWWSTRSSTTG